MLLRMTLNFRPPEFWDHNQLEAVSSEWGPGQEPEVRGYSAKVKGQHPFLLSDCCLRRVTALFWHSSGDMYQYGVIGQAVHRVLVGFAGWRSGLFLAGPALGTGCGAVFVCCGPWKTAGYHVVTSLVLLPKLLQDRLGVSSTVSAPKSLRGETA